MYTHIYIHFENSIYMVYTWYIHDIYMVYTWYRLNCTVQAKALLSTASLVPCQLFDIECLYTCTHEAILL